MSVIAAKKCFQKVENGDYNHFQRNFVVGGESDWRVHLSDLSHWTCGSFFSILFSLITECEDPWRRTMSSGFLNCSYLPRSPLGWVVEYDRVGGIAKSAILLRSFLIFYDVRHRRLAVVVAACRFSPARNNWMSPGLFSEALI